MHVAIADCFCTYTVVGIFWYLDFTWEIKNDFRMYLDRFVDLIPDGVVMDEAEGDVRPGRSSWIVG